MTDPAEREFEMIRTLSAPVALVFAALTEAEHLGRWWGPEGFGVASASSEARPGGAFSIVMRAPDGSETPVDGTYVEFDPPRHLVATTTAVAPDGTELVASTVTIDLTPRGEGTDLRLRARGVALVPDAAPMLGGMELGWVQSLRCLDDHLTGAVDRQTVLMRLLEAPPERVFEVWIAPEHLARWWSPDGTTVPNGIEYEEVAPPTMLSFVHRGFAEEDDDPPFRSTVTFDDFMGNTVLTMKSVFETVEARDRVSTAHQAADAADQRLDRLVAYVATR